MKKLKMFFAFCMAFAVMLSIIPTAFAANSTTANIDTSKKASVALYKYDFTTANENGVLELNSYVSNGEKNTAAETALANYAIKGVIFTYLKVADITAYSELDADSGKNMVLYSFEKDETSELFLTAIGLSEVDAYTVDEYSYYFTSDVLNNALRAKLDSNSSIVKNDLERIITDFGGTEMSETNANGFSSETDLDLGLYLFVETSVPENVSSTTAPFLVSLPMTNATGSEWIYDVSVYPKNETDTPTLEKTLRESKTDTGKNNGSNNDITDGYAHTATGSDGDLINYQFISTLPSITSNATALSEYTFVDSLCKGLEYNKNDVKLEWYKDADCTELITTWTETDGKFTVTYGNGADSSTTMTIKMTADGFAEINHSDTVYDSSSLYNGYSDCTVRVTYSCTVNSDADVVYGDNGNSNKVKLTWKRTNTDYYDTLTDDCHFYTYGLDITKKFADGSGNFANVQFIIHNDTDNYWVTAVLNEAEGIYYVNGHNSDENAATHFIPVTSNGQQGKIIVKGLEDDEYTITEIKTDNGYTLLRKAIKVIITANDNGTLCSVCGNRNITATATFNGKSITMAEDNSSLHALVPFKVINHKGFDIPNTGAEGTFILTFLAGFSLIGSIAFIYFRSRKRKNEKQS